MKLARNSALVFMSSALVLSLFVGCESSGPTKDSSVLVANNTPQLVVIHFGDLHGRLSPSESGVGGYARLAALIKKERQSAGPQTDVLVVAAGDLVDKGHLPCRKTKDGACLSLLSSMGVDLAVLGNAEIYRGAGGVADIVRDSRIPWISSNVGVRQGKAPWSSEYFYRGPRSGAKLWIMSWVRNPYLGREFPPELKLSMKERPLEKDWLDWTQKSSVAPILWVHHLKWEHDLSFAKEACSRPSLKSLAFVSADDHIQQSDDGFCAPVVQAAPYGEGIGRFHFAVDSEGQLSLMGHRFLSVDASIGEDPTVSQQVDTLYRRHAPKALDVIGNAPQELSQVEVGEWIARAMRQATHSDVAILNSGAIKSELSAGAVTREKLFLAAPYNNSIMGLDWSFSSLEKSLCAAASRARNPELDEGSDLYLSGAKLINAGTDRCALELERKRRSLKVVVDSYVVDRSGRWLGRDIRQVAFRFGFNTEEVVERYLKQGGGFR